jgi:hypothetical protein
VNEIIIYTSGAFVAGFAIAWIIRTINIVKIRKSENSANGSWERERLMKENAQKEVTHTQRSRLKENMKKSYWQRIISSNKWIMIFYYYNKAMKKPRNY